MGAIRSLKKIANDLEAQKIYDRALEEHPEFWEEACEKYPDYNRSQAQEATIFILNVFGETYANLYSDEDWQALEQSLYSKIHSGLT